LCDDEHNTLFDQREFRGYQVVNRMCTNCGLVFQSPRMTAPELEIFYQGEYRRVYQGSEEPGDKDLAVQKARAETEARYLRDSGIEKVKRYLDIGCSSGLLLEKIRDVYQCQVVGIEPGAAYRTYADKRGLEVYENLEAVKAAGLPAFDLISMIHVLEHIPDPVNYLGQLRNDFLTSDGKILIEVPNLYAHDCFEIAHLTSFSQNSLVQVVKMAGFKTIFLILHGQPRSTLIPLYLSILAEPTEKMSDQDWLEEERWIRLKRRTGLAHRKLVERLFPRKAWLPEYRS
jgi:SAM-dependent methyltransferase